MRLNAAHRRLGLLVLVFFIAHLGNDIAIFWGVDRHITVQTALRSVYRHPVVEPILLAGFTIQIILGLKLLISGAGQVVSGRAYNGAVALSWRCS
jgi:hypothetical protein